MHCAPCFNWIKRRFGVARPPARQSRLSVVSVSSEQAEHGEVGEAPQSSTAGREERIGEVSANDDQTTPQTRVPESNNEEPEAAEQPISPVAENLTVTENLPVVEVLPVTENLSASTQPLRSEPALDDKSPIWSKSVKRFAEQKGEKFKLIKTSVEEIQSVDRGKWDTWLNLQPKDAKREWVRKFIQRLPQIKTARVLATNLANLDPHRIAPLVVTGAFVFLEVGSQCITYYMSTV